MTIRRIFAALAVLLGLTASALAEGGGSLYSMLGVGDLQYSPSARSAGMGNAGAGMYSVSSIHPWSPASWARLDRVRMEGSLLTEGFHSTDGTRSQFLSRTSFQGILLGLPVSASDGVTIVVGMTPYSRINFDVVAPYSFTGREDTLDYTIRYRGSGGIGKAQLGASWAPDSDFAVGASFDFLFGSIDRTLIITPSSSDFSSGTSAMSTQVYGPAATLGVLFSGFGESTPGLKPLTLGAFLSTSASLHTERLTEYGFAVGNDTLYDRNTTLTVPFTYGIGLSYQIAPLVVFAADFGAQRWSAARIEDAPFTGLRDSYRFGAGIEFGGSRTFGASWWSRIAWRFGGAYIATNYEVKGTPITEWMGTLGATVPVYSDMTNDTRITIALQGGQRGTLNNRLIKDTVFRMMVSLNIGQVWFIQSRED